MFQKFVEVKNEKDIILLKWQSLSWITQRVIGHYRFLMLILLKHYMLIEFVWYQIFVQQ